MAGAWPEALRANPYVAAPEQQLLRRLAQLGLKPADISVVVLSHLHLDHAGGAHFFPRAKVYVQQEELEWVLSDYAADTLDLFHVQCDAENWEKAGIQWQAVPRETETLPLCDGITILNLGPGHSYGDAGAACEAEIRRLFTGGQTPPIPRSTTAPGPVLWCRE